MKLFFGWGNPKASQEVEDSRKSQNVMKLIVGLGNPGPTYARNRHNVGFQCLDFIAAKHGIKFEKKNMKAHWGKGTIAAQEVILAKPQTFMNVSGQSVGEIIRFFKLDPAKDLLVIYDDLDLPVGKIRLRPDGSSGGQNGLRNIIELLGTNQVQRLRVGIGRPQHGNARDRVLNDFSREEEPVMQEIYGRVEQAVQMWLTEGLLKAMNYYNQNVT